MPKMSFLFIFMSLGLQIDLMIWQLYQVMKKHCFSALKLIETSMTVHGIDLLSRL